MSKKETVGAPKFEETEAIVSSKPSFEETVPIEEVTDEKKKSESIPSISPSPSADTTSESTTGASGLSGLPKINEGINPPGILTTLTQPKVEEPKVTIVPQGLSAATTPSYQTTGDVNTTGGTSPDQSSLGKGINAVLGSDKAQSFLKGTASLGASLARTPAFLADLTNRAINTVNPIPQVTGMLPSNASEIKNPVAESLEESAKKIGQDVDKDNLDAEGNAISATDHFSKGEYAKGFDKMLNSVSESLPVTLSLMAGNVAGASGTALAVGATPVFAAGEKQALKASNPEMTDEQMNNVSLMSGALESVTEAMFGNVKLGNLYKNLFAKEGEEAAKKTIGEGVKKIYAKALKPYVGNVAEEMASEMSNQYLDNLNHKYIGGDDKVNPFDNVMEAGIVAIGSAGTLGAPGAALSVARQRTDVKKAQAIKDQQDAIKTELSNPNITPETKTTLVKEYEHLNAEEDQLSTKATDDHNKLPEEKKKEVDDLLKENHATATAALDPNLSKEAKEALQQQIEKNDKKVEETYKENQKQLDLNEKNGITADATFEEHDKEHAETLAKLKEEIKKEQEAEKEKELAKQEAEKLKEEKVSKVETPEVSNVEEKAVDVPHETKTEEPKAEEKKVETPTNTLVDEETAAGNDNEEAVTKLEDHITSLKKTAFPIQKHAAILRRIDEAVADKTISKSTGNTFRKIADQVLAGKTGKTEKEVKAQRKAENRAIADKVSDAILNPMGKDGKGIVKNEFPGVDKAVRKLLAYAADVVTTTQNLGYDIAKAVDKAWEHTKNSTLYKNLVKTGSIADEKKFEKDFREHFENPVEPTEQEDVSRQQTTTNGKAEPDIYGEKREYAIVKRLKGNEKLKKVFDFFKSKDLLYDSVSSKKATTYVNQLLDTYEKNNALIDLADALIKGTSPTPEELDFKIALRLADKLNIIAESETNEFTKKATFEKAAELSMWWGKEANLGGKKIGIAADDIANMLPSSKEGLRTYAAKQIETLHDQLLTPEEKSQIDAAAKEINEMLSEDSLTDKDLALLNTLVDKKIKEISDKINGKETADKINDFEHEMLVDLTDC